MTTDLFDFESRVWKREEGAWCWEVRHEGSFSKPFDGGTKSTRKEAKAAVDFAIERELVQLRTPWRPVKRA